MYHLGMGVSSNHSTTVIQNTSLSPGIGILYFDIEQVIIQSGYKEKNAFFI